MKRGEIYEGVVLRTDFGAKGIVEINDKIVSVKGALAGQRIRFRIKKKKNTKIEGTLLEVLEKSDIELPENGCRHYPKCGGCMYQSLSYEAQMELKYNQVQRLLSNIDKSVFEGIVSSPLKCGYRNKMEFSFGDEVKDGELMLGLHQRGSFYDIADVSECKIATQDSIRIVTETLECMRGHKISYFHKKTHKGYLRHLMIRQSQHSGGILVALVTTTQTDELNISESQLLNEYKDKLLSLNLEGQIGGIIHIKNDSVADAVINQGSRIIYGTDYIYDEVCSLQFKITPFSFFQTNTLGAELLYETAREFIGSLSDNKLIFDLYSGTGTIAQILSPSAKKVIGVEIVPEAVEAAIENAAYNNLDNVEFIQGDVLKVLDEIEEKPDFLVLDPPRDGIHPKAIKKLIDYNVENILYISCKPTSLARDYEVFKTAGYEVKRVKCVDMFPFTANVEVVALLQLSN